MNDPMLKFVKAKLEENEGIAPAALSRILASAESGTDNRVAKFRNFSLFTFHFSLPQVLLAASLAIAACSWLISNSAADARQEANLANVIGLLRVADECEEGAESSSLVDTLQTWQDAPCLVSSGD